MKLSNSFFVIKWGFLALLWAIYFGFSYYVAIHIEHYESHWILWMWMTVSLPLSLLFLGRVIGSFFLSFLCFILICWAFLCFQYHPLPIGMIDAIAGTSKNEALSVLSAHPVSVFASICLWPFLGLILYYFKIPRRNFPLSVIFLSIFALSFYQATWIYFTTGSPRMSFKGWRDQDVGIIPNSLYLLGEHFLFQEPNPTPHIRPNFSLAGKEKDGVKNIIIVVGESSTSDRYGVLGYIKNTTPNLSANVKVGNACAVEKTEAMGNSTRLTVSGLLSFFTPLHQRALWDEKNLIELAKDQGYETVWLDEQDGRGPYSGYYGYLSLYADHVIRVDYNNPISEMNGSDDSMPNAFEGMIQKTKKAEKRFFVLHIWGQHQEYSQKRTQEDIDALPDADDYDRAIHHTDKILSKIVDISDLQFGRDNWILNYISDHGEEVGVGHALSRGSYSQYRIPFLIEGFQNQKWCDLANKDRTKEGIYPETFAKYLFLREMGYHVKPEALKRELLSDYVFSGNNTVYSRDQVPTDKYAGVPLSPQPETIF